MKRQLAAHPVIFLCTLLVVVATAALTMGSVDIPPMVVGRILLGQLPLLAAWVTPDWTSAQAIILLQIRLPRVLLAAAVGGGLGVAGVIFQGLLRNPLADPYIIGVSSGASLGAAVALMFLIPMGYVGFFVLPMCAFLGAVASAYLVYRLGRIHGHIQPLQLLLAGVAIASVLTAIVSFLMVLRVQNLQDVYLWLMGSLSGRSWRHFSTAAPYILAAFAASFWLARDLNILLLGEETAHSLGVDVQRLQKKALILGSLLAAAAVSVSGVIGFVGLMVPHGVRLVVGPDHRKLLPLSFLSGAIFLIVADTLARTVLSPIELPVGIITALAGGPFFLYLLRRSGT